MNQSTRPANENEMSTQRPFQTQDQLAVLIAETYSNGIFYSEFVREAKKRFIVHVLRACNGNQCRAARELNIHRNTLSRTIAELRLSPAEWDPRRQLSGRFPVRTSGAGRRAVA
jgi:DNA-binding NtrC family response regulator